LENGQRVSLLTYEASTEIDYSLIAVRDNTPFDFVLFFDVDLCGIAKKWGLQ
jgi:hypothetical protein